MTEVVIDGRALSGPGALRGMGTYLRGVLDGLASRPDLSITVLTTEPGAVPPGLTARQVRRRAPGRWADREHAAMLGFDLRPIRFDVFHSAGLDPPWRISRPWVQTIFDIAPLVFPGFAPKVVRRWARTTRRWREATKLIAI